MSRYDGLIIPRSYSDYISKTDAATLLQALQLSGVMDSAPTSGSNKPAKSGGIYTELLKKVDKVFFEINHASLFRGRCLNGSINTQYPATPFANAPKYYGLGYTLAEVYSMINNGSFSDIWVGDYFIDPNDSNRVYRIMDIDAYYNRGNSTKINKHHLIIVPDTSMASTKWYTSNDTSVGYAGSTIRQTIEGSGNTVQSKEEAFFGASHLLPMNQLVPVNVDSWNWSASIEANWTPKLRPMTEVEVCGSSMFGNGCQQGNGCTWLAGFRLKPELAIGMNYTYWLISIYSSADACFVSYTGRVDGSDASSSIVCRPLSILAA